MADPTITVEPPRRRPRRGGILTVAEVRDNVDRIAAGANVQYVAAPCDPVHDTPGACWGAVVPDAPKVFAGIADAVGVVPAFGRYAGVECYLGPDVDYDERATELLQGWEGREIEEALFAWLDAAPVDVTAADVVAAVGALEQIADLGYIGLPIMHMSRTVAEQGVAAQVLLADREGNLVTGNGTPVVASGAYRADGVWLSGDVTVFRSAITVSRGQNLALNRELALAERGYAIAVDCEYRRHASITPTP